MITYALKISDLMKTHSSGKANETEVLRGAHLEIYQGEVVALVAPSGSGKTTLLQLAGLLDYAQGGQVEICGQDMAFASDRRRAEVRRKHIGIIREDNSLLADLSVKENVVLPQILNGVGRKVAEIRAASLLNCVQLSDYCSKKPEGLTDGEKQRVSMCRSLANGPNIVLADEPTGGLGATSSDREFRMLVKMCKETGISALIATHNEELAALADRIVDLRHGLTSTRQVNV